jgi:hypothetical protein
MGMLSFVWREFSYDAWLRILGRLAGDRRAVYSFLRFASGSLAMDVRRLNVPYANVQAELRSDAFRTSIPRPMPREVRRRLDDDFDYESVWRRLQEEGAPMQELPGG